MNQTRKDLEYKKIIDFLDNARVPYHECQPPSTTAKFLGWIVDTSEMTVSMTQERLAWLKTTMMSKVKVSRKFIATITGILEFLSTVLPFLRAPLGWIRRRANEQDAGRESCDDLFSKRFLFYWRYIQKITNKWQGKANIQRISKAEEKPDVHLYCDASGEIGFGAINQQKQTFIKGLWSNDEKQSAQREKSVSSTHLEILCICKSIRSLIESKESVKIHCDSISAVWVLTKRYCKHSDDIQAMIIGIDEWCLSNDISLFFEHTPRENEWIRAADDLSKDKVKIY